MGRPDEDEMFAYLRREWARAQSPSIVSAHILETMPPLFPDVSDRFPAPSCSPDFRRAMSATTFGDGQVVFSRMLVARVFAVGAIEDTTEVMDDKAAYLMRLVELSPERLTPYRRLPDEQGPTPPKSVIRYLALDRLVHANLYWNVGEARSFLQKRLQFPRDDREALIVSSVAGSVLDDTRRDNPSPEARSLFPAWIPDIRRRLNLPRGEGAGAEDADAISFELVMHRLETMRVFGARLRADPAARALIAEIVARRGDYPSTKGLPERSFDLAVAASGARYALEVPQSAAYPGRPPPPTRIVFSPTQNLAPPENEPVGMDEARQRMRELDGELGNLHREYPRCVVLREQAHWVPDADAETRFREMSSRIFAPDGSVLPKNETACRIRSAADIRGVSDDARIAMLLRIRETTGAPPHAVIAAVVRHPEWIARSKELRRWFSQFAREMQIPDGLGGQWSLIAHPIFDALLAFLADRGELAEGRAILTAFMATIREASTHAAIQHSVYPYEAAIARIYSVGRYAVAFGLRSEAASLLASLPEGSKYQKYGPAQHMASTMLELSAK
ncbi:hypothetical protein LZC95_51360 [Pendulispora brunnea]|uniref:Uncharacterized protein n=1 Tax=Pendulispora brunnea TaxID=2905690 RepID=A0ABZ2KD63_9BACT